jgi:hypothetical protein
MQISIEDVKKQIVQMEEHHHELERQLANLESAVAKKKEEIRNDFFKLRYYEASNPTLPQAKLKIWHTVKIGCKTLSKYMKGIKANRSYNTINGYAKELATEIELSRSVRSIKLGKMNVQELGFKQANLKALFKSICDLGGQPCLPEVPLALLCENFCKLKNAIFYMKSYGKFGNEIFCIESGIIYPRGHNYYESSKPIPYSGLDTFRTDVEDCPIEKYDLIFQIPDNIKL